MVIVCLFQVCLCICFVSSCSFCSAVVLFVSFCGHFVSLTGPSFLTLKLLCDSLRHFVSLCVSFESFFEVVL